MLKVYKNEGKGGNGEFVIVTDASNLDSFRTDLATALVAALDKFEGDDFFTANGILVNAIPIMFKLAGYKADEVHEVKHITCGHSQPAECSLITEV